MSELSTGGWRGPQGERLPGPPATEESGIPETNPAELLPAEMAARALAMIARTQPDVRDLRGMAQTDASGNVSVPVERVTAGYELHLKWLIVTDDTHTFGSTYSAGTDWIGVYVCESEQSPEFTIDNLLDGGPTSAGGPILPIVFEYTHGAERVVRGPGILVVRIVGDSGIASKRISVRGQGELRRKQGVV